MGKCSSAKPSSEANMVKSVNNAYYKALSARDMCAMEKVWTCASNNMLIAPPTNPATHMGWEAINFQTVSALPLFGILTTRCVRSNSSGRTRRRGHLVSYFGQ